MSYEPTPYDLRWRMFGFSCRVHPAFWLLTLFCTWQLSNFSFALMFVAIGVIFVSILLHELGHAVAFRVYGSDSLVVLYGFGGMAIPDISPRRRAQRVMVSLAGPLVNFAIAATVYASDKALHWSHASLYALFAYGFFITVNVFLGAVNLLPVYPLDGGRISRELFVGARGDVGYVQSLKLSIGVAVAFAAYGVACHFNLIPPDVLPWWLQPGLFSAILFALLAVQNYQELENARRSPWY